MTDQLCTVHPDGKPPEKAVKRFDQQHWCATCLEAMKKEIIRRAKARGLPANKVVVAYAMLRVGEEGRRVDSSRKLG